MTKQKSLGKFTFQSVLSHHSSLVPRGKGRTDERIAKDIEELEVLFNNGGPRGF